MTIPLWHYADIDLLLTVAKLDWSEVDPSIFGTLFERGLDPDKRSQLGAHYTDRTKIDLLIDPVILRPLMAEWDTEKTKIVTALANVGPSTSRVGKKRAHVASTAIYRNFLHRLRRFRVLDPACGSGNFLYLALLALKDLEHRASLEAEALGLQREFPQVGPEVVHGLEINPYTAELARIVVWIGAIQWARRNAMPPPSNPILRPLHTIECRDALLTCEGNAAPWPDADVIVGNPPFLGDKEMIGVLGEDYTHRLRSAYSSRVPGSADLVCYWFEKAREAVESGRCGRVGLVGTQSIHHA
jgi:type II restriction/modification system DNA methylase subunit YeeA